MSVPGAKYFLALLAGLLILACACEPEPTPLPSILPTAQPTQEVEANATPASLRYALAPNALAYLTDVDRALIAASAEIIPLDAPSVPEDLGARYDIVVTVGEPLVSDGTTAPAPLQITLLIDTTRSPLDDFHLASLVWQIFSSDPPLIARAVGVSTALPQATPMTLLLREDFANIGYPDGFDLTLASPFARNAEAIAQVLAVYGIETRLVAGEPANLTVTNIPPTDSLSAIEVPLYTLPISYRAVDGLTITFTPSGFPIASR